MTSLNKSLSSELGRCADWSNQISSFDGAFDRLEVALRYFIRGFPVGPSFHEEDRDLQLRHALEQVDLLRSGHRSRREPRIPRK